MKAPAVMISLQLLSLLIVEALTTASNEAPSSASPQKILRSSRDYHLLEEVPHDTSSFTQGLTYYDGHIYEGTGLEQRSVLMRHDPSNQMETLNKIPITPSHLFGEGISYYYVWKTDDQGNRIKEHRIIQLTWKDKVGKIYSLPELALIKEFTYQTVTTEGWGITFVPHRNEFYVSDGSEYLMVWDAETLEEKRRIVVTFQFQRVGTPPTNVKYVNELEFVDFAANENLAAGQCGESGTCSDDAASPLFTPTMKILANIWYQDVLVAIDPISGEITRAYDLSDIYPLKHRQAEGADCLNGIAVTGADRKTGEGLEIWVTGKLWPKMHRIQLID